MKLRLKLGSILFTQLRIAVVPVVRRESMISHPFGLHPIPCREDIARYRIVGPECCKHDHTGLRPVGKMVFPAIDVRVWIKREAEGHGEIVRKTLGL